MNEFDISTAQRRHAHHPVKSRAVRIINDLRELADSCSDGWCYWKKPVNAARKLIELIEDTPDDQATEKALTKALAPIKAFLTREAKFLGGRTICFGE